MCNILIYFIIANVCEKILFFVQKIYKYQSCSFGIYIAIDPIFVKSENSFACREAFIVEWYRDIDECFEFFAEFCYSLSMLRHSAIDIIGHSDNDLFSFPFLYPFGKYCQEFCSEYGFPCKTKSCDRVGKPRLPSSIIYGYIVLRGFHIYWQIIIYY